MPALFITAAVIIVLLLWALFPGKKPENYEHFKGLYAHRGLHGVESPENTLEAFEKAVKKGYGMELDVQLTKDGKVVVFHDDDLKRVCGIDERVDKFTFEELSRIPVKGTESRIPLFEDVLALVAGRVPMIVELKTTKDSAKRLELCEKTYALLKDRKNFCVESFDPRIVRWFKKNAPGILRGQLSCNHMRGGGKPFVLKLMLTCLFLNFLGRPHFIAYNYPDMGNVFYKFVTGPLGAVSVAWTVRDKETFAELKNRCDIIIFENFLPTDT